MLRRGRRPAPGQGDAQEGCARPMRPHRPGRRVRPGTSWRGPLASWCRADLLTTGRQFCRSARGRTGRGITVEPRGGGCHGGGIRPIRRLAAHPLSLLQFMWKRYPAVVPGPVHSVDGRLRRRSAGVARVWTSAGDGRWAPRRGGGRSGRAGTCPLAEHRLSTDSAAAVHRHRCAYPQSCPQMWVKSWSRCERSATGSAGARGSGTHGSPSPRTRDNGVSRRLSRIGPGAPGARSPSGILWARR